MRTNGFIFSVIFLVSGCGKSAGDILPALLCTDGHAKNKLTMGLNLDFFKDLFLMQSSGPLLLGANGFADAGVDNDLLKGYLNKSLSTLGISESKLSVATVESVDNDKTDKVRFMSLKGDFANGFGVATSLFKQALSATKLQGSTAYEFLNESFNVVAAADLHQADQGPFDQVPDLEVSAFMADSSYNPSQWVYQQTDYAQAKQLWQGLRDKYLTANPDKAQEPVIVAVLDTGVDLSHPDLKDVLSDKQYDAVNSGTGAQDENGHGTHCAGIIAAKRNSDKSPLGVANIISSNVKIMPIKVLGKTGGGGFQEIEKGIRYAMRNGAQVISMSLGGGMEYKDLGEEKSLQNQIIKEAIAQGIIVVIAAGNESCPLGGECSDKGLVFPKKFKEYTVLPCAYQDTICIGATDADESLASYSNYSSNKDGSYRTKVDVNAPGTQIYSTWPTQLEGGGYKSISGTSMATPYVAGIAALVKAVDPTVTQTQFRDLIKASQAFPEELKQKSGAGRLDLYTVAKRLADGLPPSQATVPDSKKVVEAPTSRETGGAGLDVSSLFSAFCRQ